MIKWNKLISIYVDSCAILTIFNNKTLIPQIIRSKCNINWNYVWYTYIMVCIVKIYVKYF